MTTGGSIIITHAISTEADPPDPMMIEIGSRSEPNFQKLRLSSLIMNWRYKELGRLTSSGDAGSSTPPTDPRNSADLFPVHADNMKVRNGAESLECLRKLQIRPE